MLGKGRGVRTLVTRLWRLAHTPTGRRMVRYSMVSAISTGISNGVLFVVYGVLGLWSEVPSTVFANLSATGPAYYLNRHWTWGRSGRSHVMREVIPFWSISAAGIALSILTSSEARHLSDVHHLHHAARTALVLGANIGAFGTLWVLKFLLFNRLFRVRPAAEPEAGREAGRVVETPGAVPAP